MIPLAATIAFRGSGALGRELWIPVPLLLIWLLLLPFGLLLLPLFVIACAVVRISPWRALAATWRLLAALRATRVDIERREALIRVHIY